MQVLTWFSVFSGCLGPLEPFWQRLAVGIKSDAFDMSGILHFCSLCKCILSRLGTSQTRWCLEASSFSKRQGQGAVGALLSVTKKALDTGEVKMEELTSSTDSVLLSCSFFCGQSRSSPSSPRE